jgi:hypothetical protein
MSDPLDAMPVQPPIEVTPITLADLTAGDKKDGNGAFDVIMRSVKEHIGDEYTQGRIQGTEYSQVYLGALEQTMGLSMQFLLAKDKTALEQAILQAELQKIGLEQQRIWSEKLLIDAQIDKIAVEIELAEMNKGKITKEIAVMTQDIALSEQKEAQSVAETTLLGSKNTNEIKNGAVIDATVCKLKAEYDLLVLQGLKVTSETTLLDLKQDTEKAQTTGTIFDDTSVLGAQTAMYAAQTKGYAQNAQQKAAEIMIATWNTRRMTDEATPASVNNALGDPDIKAVVRKLQNGIGVTEAPTYTPGNNSGTGTP